MPFEWHGGVNQIVDRPAPETGNIRDSRALERRVGTARKPGKGGRTYGREKLDIDPPGHQSRGSMCSVVNTWLSA
jgi:hypothetical protein